MAKILTIPEFCKGLNLDVDKILGLDIGAKTIGIALAHFPGGIVTPHTVITRTKIVADAAILKKIITEYQINSMVVGWPLNADGSYSRRCQATNDILLELMKFIPALPICYYDERFTTQKAESFMIHKANFSRKKRDKLVDKMAAQIILTEFLYEHLGVLPAYT